MHVAFVLGWKEWDAVNLIVGTEDPMSSVPLKCREIIVDHVSPGLIRFKLDPDEIIRLESEILNGSVPDGINTIMDLCRYKIRQSLSKEE